MENLAQPIPESQPEVPATPPPLALIVQPKKSKKNFWIIVIVIILMFCFCSTPCIVGGIFLGYNNSKETGPIEGVLDSYMKDLAAKDVNSAYALFSPRFQRQQPESKLQEMIEGNNYILFEGYQNLSVQNINWSMGTDFDQNIPQGFLAKVSGIINYEGGVQGSFNGVLEKDDNMWKLDGIWVSVPPSKLKP
jgi:hypothetical protein